MDPRRRPPAHRSPRLLLTLLAVAALAAAGAGAVAAQGRRAAPPPPAVATADPVRAALTAALAPGLADTTRARLEAFIAAHGRHPLAREARQELGLLAYARGDYALARDDFRRARPSSGGDESRYWEALSSFALGRPREARALALSLARATGRHAGPRRWDAAYLVALCWAQEGRKPEALAAYRELFALPAAGGEAAALYQGVGLARELGRTDDATTWRARLLARAPGSPEAASLLADKPAPGAARADSGSARRR